MVRLQNQTLQRKLAEHLRAAKKSDENKETDRSVTDQEQRYYKSLAQVCSHRGSGRGGAEKKGVRRAIRTEKKGSREARREARVAQSGDGIRER